MFFWGFTRSGCGRKLQSLKWDREFYEMGMLRLLLALSVVAGHSQTFFRPFFFINAKAAVICFFVISGFYMAMVMNEKYTSKAVFLMSRWVRIYAPYIVVTLIYGIYLHGAGRLQLDRNSLILNVSLIGQDAFRILNWFPPSHEMLGNDVIAVPQAWSLSVELQLYLVAAFLFSFRYGIVATMAFGIIFRTYSYFHGYVVPPYAIMFSLNVLVFFALGGMAYLSYTFVRTLKFQTNVMASIVILTSAAFYTSYYGSFLTMNAETADARFLPLYGMTALLVPFLFAITKDIEIDRMLGDLSYPTYLVHIAVIDIASQIEFSQYGIPYAKSYFILGITLSLAVVMCFAIEWKRWSLAFYAGYSLARSMLKMLAWPRRTPPALVIPSGST
jgi:peptidoglycan/LPS O-acetylase OafA/YrhL